MRAYLRKARVIIGVTAVFALLVMATVASGVGPFSTTSAEAARPVFSDSGPGNGGGVRWSGFD